MRNRLVAAGAILLLLVLAGCKHDAGRGKPAHPETAKASTQATGPLTEFDSGEYWTGDGPGLIPNGTYETTVPGVGTNLCYYNLSHYLADEPDEHYVSGGIHLQFTVNLSEAHYITHVETTGCGRWKKKA